jgi:hypothetical protein
MGAPIPKLMSTKVQEQSPFVMMLLSATRTDLILKPKVFIAGLDW